MQATSRRRDDGTLVVEISLSEDEMQHRPTPELLRSIEAIIHARGLAESRRGAGAATES